MNCKTCGKEFEPKQNTQVYCSDKCRNRGTYLRHLAMKDKLAETEFVKFPQKTRTGYCANCRRRFEKYFPGERFCSDQCRLEYFNL